MHFSDEDEECEDILMYLSISPEVDNPDDLSGGEESVSTQNSERPNGGGGASKNSLHSTVPTVPIHLPGAPTDEVSY
ncbi:unnamed protein product [Trichobilharzia regenti]|nr:unnamed protein product [Trichobilharzia regenti]